MHQLYIEAARYSLPVLPVPGVQFVPIEEGQVGFGVAGLRGFCVLPEVDWHATDAKVRNGEVAGPAGFVVSSHGH